MLKDNILKTGVSNCLFVVPFQKIMKFGDLPPMYTFSNYESPKEYLIPAVIDESIYKIRNNYKITLKPLHPDFASKSFYLSDLETLIENKIVKPIFVY